MLVIITPKETSSSFAAAALLLLLLTPHLLRPPPPPCIHVYTLFFRIEKNNPGLVFFLLETMQVGIKFTISLIRLSGYLVPLQ